MAFDFDEEKFQGALPGEAMTHAPGKFPFDRPARISDPEQAFDALFTQIRKPKTTNKLLDALELGAPVETTTSMILTSMAEEGIIPITLAPVLGPPVATLIEEIAKQAEVKVVRDEDLAPDEATEISLDDLQTLSGEVVEQVEEEAPQAQGLMAPPEGL